MHAFIFPYENQAPNPSHWFYDIHSWLLMEQSETLAGLLPLHPWFSSFAGWENLQTWVACEPSWCR
eukprot:5457238-Amphidinium_carterae.9